MGFYFPWDREALRRQAAIVAGKAAPTLVLSGAEYLNASLKAWERANIWIDRDRIVYVGERMPLESANTEIIDCSEYVLVPGYIEPHAHPFQLYNPWTFAAYAAERGTTTLIADNLVFFTELSDDDAFSIIERLADGPTTWFWWCRYDAQTLLREQPFNSERIRKWLEHPLVIQGGELTGWPGVLQGDDDILEWMIATKKAGKTIEGHLPGASEKTLTQLELLGVDCDHEAMTGEEAWRRLRLGLSTSLRYSSIRPDLPDILRDLLARGVKHFDRLYMTTDGSTPAFYEQGIMDRTVEIALEQGVPEIEAYLMATANPARHYGIHRMVGEIAPGRLAHINILEAKDKPTPVSILAKGRWVKRDGAPCYPETGLSVREALGGFSIDWDLDPAELEPDTPVGIDMVNAVITQPFTAEAPVGEEPPEGVHYLTLYGRDGRWKLSTWLKGFGDRIAGFASSYSSTGDILLIGKNKTDMVTAFQRMKAIGGGMVLVEDGRVLAEIPLAIRGWVSDKPLPELMEEERALTALLRARGYRFADPVYTLLFLSATHLPYIRLTQRGLVDVMKREVLVPAIER
jgi:adenine deaminase